MKTNTKEYIVTKPVRATASALASGFTTLRRCEKCGTRRSPTQYAAGSTVCVPCGGPKP